jgi:hypothetical protein
MSLFTPFTYFGTPIVATLNYVYRNDPFSASLVFATPCSQFSTLGMGSAWSDVEAGIRGTGANKTVATSASLQTNATYIKFGSDGYIQSLAMTASAGTPAPSIFSQNSTDFNFGSGNFTIECWHNPGAGTSARRMFFQKYVTGVVASCELFWNIGLNNTNAVGFAYDGGGGETGFFPPATASLTSNTWTHYALVRNGATSFIAYINGVPAGGTTTNRTLNTTTTPAFLLGGNYNLPYQTGYLQDYRIYKGVAKYTASFTPPPSMITTA